MRKAERWSGSRLPRVGLVLLSATIALSLLTGLASAVVLPVAGQDYVSNQVIVGLRAKSGTLTIPLLAQRFGLTVVKQLPTLKAGLLKVQPGRDVLALAEMLKQVPEVRLAEPNYLCFLALAAPDDPAYNDIDYFTPPDPIYATWYQWDLHLIDALGGWSVWPNLYYTSATKPVDAVKVAVVDSGIDPGHADFINAGGSSTDAALGGQIDIADSANVITGYVGPYPGIEDELGHGTHVSGTIAAATNSGQSYPLDGGGMAGIGYNGQIVVAKIFDSSGYATWADVAAGIIHGADKGAKVINLSVGGYWYSQLVQDAVKYAWGKGALCVAAACNESQNYWPSYPAGNDYVLAVSSTTLYDTLATYSNWGDWVGIAAPGGDTWTGPAYLGTWSTTPTYGNLYGVPDYYAYLEGTSMATPHVAGLGTLYAGYRKALTGTDATPLEIYQAIQKGADNIASTPNGGWEEVFGYGRINVASTLAGINTRGSTVGCITGQVLAASAPLALAAVRAVPVGGGTIYSTKSRTDDGCYRLANLPAGTYNVTALFSTKTVTVSNVVVSAGCDTPGIDLDFGSQPLSGTIAGRVTDRYGWGVWRANVWVRRSSSLPGNWVSKVTTDYAGNYVCGSLAPGTYTMQVSAFGYRTKVVYGIVVTAGLTTWVNVTLTP